MAGPYNPPVANVTIELSWESLVASTDPEYTRKKHRELEYDFIGRNFYGDPYTRGAYAAD